MASIGIFEMRFIAADAIDGARYSGSLIREIPPGLFPFGKSALAYDYGVYHLKEAYDERG